MLYELTPSSEVTGGAWYTDQELDVDFIDTLAAACYKYIYSRVCMRVWLNWIYLDCGWYLRWQSFPKDRNVIFKAGYDHYPSAAEVKRFIQEKRISSVELNLQDIICLLDLLIHDDLIEKKMPFETFMDDDEDMDDEKDDGIEWVYKAIHRNITSTTSDDRGIDPLSEVPCGKCPVCVQAVTLNTRLLCLLIHYLYRYSSSVLKTARSRLLIATTSKSGSVSRLLTKKTTFPQCT